MIQDSLEENNGFGNWDAGERLLVKGSTGRKIWTAIDTNQYGDAGYTGGGGWNNWNTSNAAAIQNLFEATKAAFKAAKKNGKGSILLSPGCSSHDQFKNFEDRGNVFVKAIASLLDEEKNAENF